MKTETELKKEVRECSGHIMIRVPITLKSRPYTGDYYEVDLEYPEVQALLVDKPEYVAEALVQTILFDDMEHYIEQCPGMLFDQPPGAYMWIGLILLEEDPEDGWSVECMVDDLIPVKASTPRLLNLEGRPFRDLEIAGLISGELVLYEAIVQFKVSVSMGVTIMDVIIQTDDERLPDLIVVKAKSGSNEYELTQSHTLGLWMDGYLHLAAEWPRDLKGLHVSETAC